MGIATSNGFTISGYLRIRLEAIDAYTRNRQANAKPIDVWVRGVNDPFVIDCSIEELDAVLGVTVVKEG